MSMTTTTPDHEQRRSNLPAIAGPRLPYHPTIGERFGIDKASWKALVEAIFPNATSVESVILALSYCRARRLDPFKKNVHIVPIWSKDLGRMVDTVWPGIGELRTTAFRTGEYAGRGETNFGPDLTQKVGSVDMTFPEWAQVTVYRMVKGQRVEFCGPRVYWLETYATVKRNDDSPNEMWKDRPRGQIEKCAEAAALRAAFPEELGGEHIPEEVQHAAASRTIEGKAVKSLDQLGQRLQGPVEEPQEQIGDDGEVLQEGYEQPEQTAANHSHDIDPITLAAAKLADCKTLDQVDQVNAEILRMDLTDEQGMQLGQLIEQRQAEIENEASRQPKGRRS